MLEKGVTLYNAVFIPQCVGESEQIIAGVSGQKVEDTQRQKLM